MSEQDPTAHGWQPPADDGAAGPWPGGYPVPPAGGPPSQGYPPQGMGYPPQGQGYPANYGQPPVQYGGPQPGYGYPYGGYGYPTAARKEPALGLIISFFFGFWIWGMVDAYTGATEFNRRHGYPG
ncbi:hypothetical protein ACMYYO_13215 [Dermacoccaceae bacterium W4C1]